MTPAEEKNKKQAVLQKVVEKKLDMKQLSGKLKWKGDPLALQRKLRSNDR